VSLSPWILSIFSYQSSAIAYYIQPRVFLFERYEASHAWIRIYQANFNRKCEKDEFLVLTIITFITAFTAMLLIDYDRGTLPLLSLYWRLLQDVSIGL
jgi:hypothetical protein